MHKWSHKIVRLSALTDHHINGKIYGKPSLDADMLESVRNNGILDPLHVTKDLVVLSGHRRKLHAGEAALQDVPVLECQSDLEDEEAILLLIEFNRSREKTNEVRIREGAVITQVQAELAKKRRLGNLKKGKNEPNPPSVPNGDTRENGRAIDLAAEEVGLSSKTLTKGIKVIEKIDSLNRAGNGAEAAELQKTLAKSISAAHKAMAPAPPRKPEQYNDEKIDGLMKSLVVEINQRARVLGHVGTAGYRAVENAAESFYKRWLAWQAETRR